MQEDKRTATKAVLFYLVLHFLISAYRWLPQPTVAYILVPIVELPVLFAVALFAARTRIFWRRLALGAATVLSVILVLFSFGETFYRTIYQEGFVPWTDLAFVPAFLNMVLDSSAFSRPAVMVLLYLGVIGVVSLPVYWGLLNVGRAMDSHRRPAYWMLGILFSASLSVTLASDQPPLTVRAAAQIRPPAPVFEEKSPAAIQIPDTDAGESDPFPVLGDSDLHLIIVESYGHTLFSREDHRTAIADTYATVEKSLREAGYASYSHFMESPAFGGRSWLADATLLTGLFLDTQAKYNEVVHSDRQNLTHILGDAGFYRLFAAPGTYEAEGYWRSFYQYDTYLFRYDFGYQGPFISFGAMPDQYLLHTALSRATELRGDASLFATYVLVSSHVPFERVPPYIEDWSQLGDGTIFAERPYTEFDNNWLSGSEYPEGYIASVEYVLRTIVDFVIHRLSDDSLVVIVGDHQPRIPIAEQDATYSVPVHVVSRDPEKVRPFRQFGFLNGMVPRQDLPHPRMDEFLTMLLAVLDGSAEIIDVYNRNVPK